MRVRPPEPGVGKGLVLSAIVLGLLTSRAGRALVAAEA